jgi:hypothetical protein
VFYLSPQPVVSVEPGKQVREKRARDDVDGFLYGNAYAPNGNGQYKILLENLSRDPEGWEKEAYLHILGTHLRNTFGNDTH